LNTTGAQSNTVDLNDPNISRFPKGIIGNDSEVGFRLSGSYTLPYDINVAGVMVANSGYPFVSLYPLTRAVAATQGINLTRASQVVFLSNRGEERYDNVVLADLRLGKTFRFGGRNFTPQIDFFNITNADTVVNTTVNVGPSYLLPAGGDPILSPRIIRIGFSLDF